MRIACLSLAALFMLSFNASAGWDDAKGRGIFPYWQACYGCQTVFIFVNGSEDTEETIYIELRGMHDSFAPERREFRLSPREMLILSTSPNVGEWVPVPAGFGYAAFRCQHGGLIHPLCAVVNLAAGTGYTVPAYHEDGGF
ncbi:MAG TPA: hypothetical protein VM163_06450 [bacterium]|nr:hypothetical protein [bacterium]